MRCVRLFPIFIGLIMIISFNCAYGEDFVFVDLEPYANSKILDTNWWTGDPGNTDMEELLEIAQDGHVFEGPGGDEVPFKIVDAVINVFGTNAANNPEKVEGIQIGMAAESVYFVHMTGWEAVGVPSYKFVINYDDGSFEELLMESDVNSDNWDQVPAPLSDENSAWIWEETAVTVARGGVIATKWENPNPGKRIETIDFVSLNTAAVPALFAITLGGASAAVEPVEKVMGTWAEVK
ncbi:hypothetical protein GF312_14285 [Candidatus Poribacteria bacterium]|nr:hypothetical protein [Candidatus Poribacteria bacterium]